ncbi:hypothetical protein BJX76DRAFT_343940 [Aspergillus varians]
MQGPVALIGDKKGKCGETPLPPQRLVHSAPSNPPSGSEALSFAKIMARWDAQNNPSKGPRSRWYLRRYGSTATEVTLHCYRIAGGLTGFKLLEEIGHGSATLLDLHPRAELSETPSRSSLTASEDLTVLRCMILSTLRCPLGFEASHQVINAVIMR